MQLTNVTLVTADSEDGQAGHVQDGPAPVIDDAAREEAHPSRGGSAGSPSSAAAVTSSGKTAESDLTSVCALTAPASPVSIKAPLQPSPPPHWSCQDHHVLIRQQQQHHHYLSSHHHHHHHHHHGFLHHHYHISIMACKLLSVSQSHGILNA